MSKMERIARELLFILAIAILFGIIAFGFIMFQEGESGWVIASTIAMLIFYLMIIREK